MRPLFLLREGRSERRVQGKGGGHESKKENTVILKEAQKQNLAFVFN